LQKNFVFHSLQSKHVREYYAQYNSKVCCAIMENDATQTNEVSKYQLIRQPKLDKFHCSNATANVWSDVHSFPLSNKTICATDQQFRVFDLTILCCRPDHSWKRHLLTGNAH